MSQPMSDPAFASLSLDHHSNRRSVFALFRAEVSAFISEPRYRIPFILSGLGTLLLCTFLAVHFHGSRDVDGFPTSIEEESYLADLVDPFEPRLELTVVFGIRPLLDGVHVSVEEGEKVPEVTLVRLEGERATGSLYTLVREGRGKRRMGRRRRRRRRVEREEGTGNGGWGNRGPAILCVGLLCRSEGRARKESGVTVQCSAGQGWARQRKITSAM